MFLSRYVDKSEVKELDGSNPLIDGCARLDVRIIEHTSDILCIQFDYQVSNTDNVHSEST